MEMRGRDSVRVECMTLEPARSSSIVADENLETKLVAAEDAVRTIGHE